MLYNWAVEHPASVACIAGIYPVCNLSSFPGIKRASGAYGLTEAQLAAQLAEHNPVDRLEPLAKARVPIFHFHGDSDTVAPLDQNSAAVAERYRHFGGDMTLGPEKTGTAWNVSLANSYRPAVDKPDPNHHLSNYGAL